MVGSTHLDTVKQTPQVYEKCPLEELVNIIGGKWKIIILWHLREGTLRFGQLRRLLPGITQKMLTQQLRELEDQGMVTRKIYAEVPPRVEYTLTPLALKMRKLLQAMQQWSEQHLL
jgi:DNA-binding HxlR family transcriptional regulator